MRRAPLESEAAIRGKNMTCRKHCTAAIQLARLRVCRSEGLEEVIANGIRLSLVPFARYQLLAFTPFSDFMDTFYILVNIVASVIKNDALPLSLLSLR
jgi:hypothetical protein